jgi:hypothetical protein
MRKSEEEMLFVMEKPLIGCYGARLRMLVLGKFDWSTFKSIDRTQTKMRSIDFPKFPNSMYFYLKFVISLLMSYKTQKHQN